MSEPKFEDFEIGGDILDALDQMGFQHPTPIQTQAIPMIIDGKDLLACAQTGTGKTAAFLIPILERIMWEEEKAIRAVIIVPTRELAIQIEERAQAFAYFTDIGIISVYGGKAGDEFSRQKQALSTGAELVIATPGRLMQHIHLGYVDFSGLKYLILDEADKMLDMGFYEDIQFIISKFPTERQNLMFSATMPAKIKKLAKEILTEPEEIKLAVSKPAEKVRQLAYLTYDGQKLDTLLQAIEDRTVDSMVIFAGRKSSVDQIERALKQKGLNVSAIHSDKEQHERADIMRRFKNHEIKFIVATDILSRGIDVDNISHVVNYDIPKDPEDYIHRIGRTARAERDGEAFSFINKEDQRYFQKIERLMEREVPKLPPPKHLGDGPSYEPYQKKGRKGKSGSGKGKRHYKKKKRD